MRTQLQNNTIITELYNNALNSLLVFEKNNTARLKIDLSDIDTSINNVRFVIDSVENIVNGAFYNGFSYPSFTSKVDVFDNNNVIYADIYVRSKLKADYLFTKRTTIFITEESDFLTDIVVFYTNALKEMFKVKVATENIVELNAVMNAITKEADKSYTISFVLDSTDSRDYIKSICDNNITYFLSVESAYALDNVSIMRSGTEYDNMIRESATAQFIKEIESIETTVQLLKSNTTLIRTILGVKSKKTAVKLIKESCHRRASNMAGVKHGVGYFNETVEIDGEDVSVFALVSKDDDDSYEVILSPFNTVTLENVNFNVLKEI